MGFRTVSKLAIVLTPLLHPRNFVVWSQSNTIIHDYLLLFLFNDFFRSDLLNFFRGLFSWYLSFCGWFNWMFLLISFSVKSQTLELILLFFTNLEITPWFGYLNKPGNFLEVHNQCNPYHLHRLPNYSPWHRSIAKCIAHKSIHRATLASIDILVPNHPEDNTCLRCLGKHKEAY